MILPRTFEEQIHRERIRANQETAQALQELNECRSRRQRLERHRSALYEDYTKVVTASYRTELESMGESGARLCLEIPTWMWKPWQARNQFMGIHNTPLPFFVAGTLFDSNDGFRLPWIIPFIGCNRAITIRSKEPESAMMTLHLMILQFLQMLPSQSRLTLLDPHEQGKAYPIAKQLKPWLRNTTGNLSEDLGNVFDDVSRIIGELLDDTTRSLEELPNEIRDQEPFEVIVAANFPNDFTEKDIGYLIKICRNGPAAGKYTILQQAQDQPLPGRLNWSDFPNLYQLNLDQIKTRDGLIRQLVDLPDISSAHECLRSLGSIRPKRTTIPFEDSVSIPPDHWWKESSAERINASIGTSGPIDHLGIYFGESCEGRQCAHGMLAASTGSGKSNFYHVLICALAQRYSPEELNLYLVDGKDGVEFQQYRHLPHAKIVVLNASAEASQSVISHLLEEKSRRNEVFATAGVASYVDYRRIGQPKGKIPRCLLLVDECQKLFQADADGVVSKEFLLLSQQGRSAGIHFLIGSQEFGTVGMLHQQSAFENIQLRIAMNMTSSGVASKNVFGNAGRKLIAATCDLPGRAVVNDRNGEDSGNTTGRIAYLALEQRAHLIEDLSTRATELGISRSTTVIDGKAQPLIQDTPAIAHTLAENHRPSCREWTQRATKPIEAGGFGLEDWQPTDHPHILWLGQKNTVHGYSRLVTHRRKLENILILGTAHSTRFGLLCAFITCLGIGPNTGQKEIRVIDGSQGNSEWRDSLKSTLEEILEPSGINSSYTRSTGTQSILNKAHAELQHRANLTGRDLSRRPSVFLFLADADKHNELHQVPDRFKSQTDSPLGAKLRELYTIGPALGIHVIISFGLVASMKLVLDRASLESFRHRIVMQLSADDSLALIQSRKAHLLQEEGPRPIQAIYKDIHSDTQIRFKPYAIDNKDSYNSELMNLSENLRKWRKPWE